LTLAVASMLFALSCSKPSAPPNVLVLTLDTTRADHLGAYGFTLARTPNIDRLASEGVLCTDAIAAAPITAVSHSTIFTGMLPPAHGVRDNGSYTLSPDAVTLAERLRDAGYATHAIVSALVLNRRYGLDQGFEQYDDDLWSEDEPKLFMIRDRPARKTADRALEWLGRWSSGTPRKPFFMWVHFFDPHQPLEPERGDIPLAASLYDAEISGVDRAIGRIVDALRDSGELDNTIVVLTADHGESLDEHGEKTHAIFVYDATLRVPLIVRYPKRFAPLRYEAPVRHSDLVPTILGLLGMKEAAGTQGVDLGPAFAGKAAPPKLSQYSESLVSEVGFGMAPLYAVRDSGFKWIRAPRPELYDLTKDPHELTNLYGSDRRNAARLDAELTKILAESSSRAIASTANPLDKETAETLMALGYLSRKSDRDAMAGMDPKDGLPIYTMFEDARHLTQEGKLDEAKAKLAAVIDKLPANVSAINVMALVALKQQRLGEARDWYLRSLSIDPGQARVYAALGALELAAENVDTAERHFRKALELSPVFVEAEMNLGFIESLRGNDAGAEALYNKARALDPGMPRVARRLGDLFYERKEWARALASYRETLRLSPRDFHAMLQAGNSARRVGDVAAAVRYFDGAAELRPDSWIPPYNKACIAAVGGDAAGALEALETSVARGVSREVLLLNDPDLASLRSDPRFASLANRAARSEGDDSATNITKSP